MDRAASTGIILGLGMIVALVINIVFEGLLFAVGPAMTIAISLVVAAALAYSTTK